MHRVPIPPDRGAVGSQQRKLHQPPFQGGVSGGSGPRVMISNRFAVFQQLARLKSFSASRLSLSPRTLRAAVQRRRKRAPSLRLRSGYGPMVAGSRKNSNELNRNKSQQYQQIDSQSPKREPDGSSHFDPWHTSVFSLIRVNS
jgi:hypothetical protein